VWLDTNNSPLIIYFWFSNVNFKPHTSISASALVSFLLSKISFKCSTIAVSQGAPVERTISLCLRQTSVLSSVAEVLGI